MLVSHFLKAPDFSTWLGSWGSAEPPEGRTKAGFSSRDPQVKAEPADI